MDQELFNQLASAAVAARKRAYVPVSHFAVGAAGLAKSGNVYAGPNIEESTIKSSTHGEGSVVAAMIRSEGYNKLTHLVALGEREGVDSGDIVCTPCGHCRQMLVEFADEELQIGCSSPDGRLLMSTTLGELLPGAFNWQAFAPAERISLRSPCSLFDGEEKSMKYWELYIEALMTVDRGHVSVTGKHVGAALATRDEVVCGQPMEEGAFTGVLHATEVALANRNNKNSAPLTLLLVSDGSGCSQSTSPFPCGHCLQSLAEFAGNDLKIIIVDQQANVQALAKFGELLPYAFRLWDFQPKEDIGYAR